ncbi:DMT family transporter [Jannaschia sp.]|nr:DMT family transporter [Jannaschia sp.]
MTSTLRSAGLMTLSMGLFAVEDALIKGLGDAFSAAQIVWMLGLGGSGAFALWFVATGVPILSPVYRRPTVLLRTAFEAVGGVFFVSALTLAPLALVSAVIQATPLVVALGATLFLGTTLGPRRWLAIGVGFVGVVVILRPGSSYVDAAAWLAVGGMLGLAGRDLVTRTMARDATGARLSIHAFAGLAVAGGVLQLLQGAPVVMPTGAQIAIMTLCVVIGMVAYLAIVAATRSGDLAVVSSFRYTRMLFALIIATLFFSERPDFWTLTGAALVIASGCYTLWREAQTAFLT